MKWIILIGFIIVYIKFWKLAHHKVHIIFLNIIGDTNKETSKNLFSLFIFAIYAIILILFINIFFNTFDKLGEWGDFFGGVLNPLLTFLTFMGLLITIVLQQTELKQSREEFKGQKESLENQEFDNKFFQMINLLTQIKNNLEFNMDKGQKVFTSLKIEIIQDCASKKMINQNSYIPVDSIDKFKNYFKVFNDEYDENFKYYFLNLYQILNYIDKNSNDRYTLKEYSNIVRAQLSKNELILLFYNGIGMLDISGNKYKTIIEKYSLFEHLTYRDLSNYVTKNGKNICPNTDLINLLLIEYNELAYGKSDLKNKRNTIAKLKQDNKTSYNNN